MTVKRTGALLLFLFLFLAALPLPAFAESSDPAFSGEDVEEAQSLSFSIRCVNPVYADVLGEEELIVSAEPEPFDAETTPEPFSFREGPRRAYGTDEPEPLENADQAAAFLRPQLAQRASSITVSFFTELKMTQTNLKNECVRVFSLALAHTGNPKEGDSLLYQYSTYNADISGKFIDEIRCVTFTYYPEYYTSAEQEAEVDRAVDAVLAQLDLDGKSEYHKIKAIYDYLCENVYFDKENEFNSAYKMKYTVYAALVQKLAVCQGFSTAFYRLCLESGVDARVVTRDVNPHAWNIVRLDSLYYELDASWDRKTNNLTPRSSYSYYMRGSLGWPSHHDTIGDQFSDSAFCDMYPLSASDFVPPVVRIVSVDLSYTDQLQMRYILNLPEMLLSDDGAWLSFAPGSSESNEKSLSELQTADGQQFFVCPVGLGDLTDEAVLTLCWSDGVPAELIASDGADVTDSFASTPLNLLEAHSGDALAVSLYDLAVASRLYFRPEDSQGLSVEPRVTSVTAAELRPYLNRTRGLPPDGCAGASLSVSLADYSSLHVYFELSKVVSAYSFSLDGQPVSPTQTETGCFLSVDGVTLGELADEHSFSISDGTDTFTVTASILGYANAAVSSGPSEAIQNLGKALYLCSQAANA